MTNTGRQVLIGGIYRHCHGLHYRVDSVGLNVTDYENGNETFPRFIVYTQLEDGKFPTGTVWIREEKDFLGTTTEKYGKIINIFELVTDKK